MPFFFPSLHSFIAIGGAVCTVICAVLSLWTIFFRNDPKAASYAWLVAISTGAVLLCAIAVVYRSTGGTNVPENRLVSDRPDLVDKLTKAFAASTAKGLGPHRAEHCALFGQICLEAAADIEVDSKLPEPGITTGEHVAEIRKRIREYRLDGNSFSGAYPSLPGVVDTFLDSEAGDNRDTLTPAMKRAWIAALNDLGTAAIVASYGL